MVAVLEVNIYIATISVLLPTPMIFAVPVVNDHVQDNSFANENISSKFIIIAVSGVIELDLLFKIKSDEYGLDEPVQLSIIRFDLHHKHQFQLYGLQVILAFNTGTRNVILCR